MKVLNLYSGIGGNRKLWPKECQVTAIENNPKIATIYQDFFPNDKVMIEEAHKYLLDHYKEFDFIWTSPPCPTHSDIRRCGVHAGKTYALYPDMELYEEIIFLKHFAPLKTKWVVENVKSYYNPLIKPHYAGRHYFWSNFHIAPLKVKYDIGTMNRQATEKAQRRAIIREAQIPELTTLHGLDLKGLNLPNKRQVLRNCVLPELGLHVFNCAFKGKQTNLMEVKE